MTEDVGAADVEYTGIEALSEVDAVSVDESSLTD